MAHKSLTSIQKHLLQNKSYICLNSHNFEHFHSSSNTNMQSTKEKVLNLYLMKHTHKPHTLQNNNSPQINSHPFTSIMFKCSKACLNNDPLSVAVLLLGLGVEEGSQDCNSSTHSIHRQNRCVEHDN